jgi:hypothetical protein
VTAGSDGVLRVWGPGPPPDTDQVPVPQDVVPEAVANDTERSPETEGRSRLVINIDYA